MDLVSGRGVEVTIGSAVFKNPVFLASGPAGYGLEYETVIDLAVLGGVVAKTITYKPLVGNRGARLRETPSGLLNSIGLENVGCEAFLSEKLPAMVERGMRPIVSIGAEGWEDYERLLERLSGTEGFDAVEINLSCPNVDIGGMAVGRDPELVEKYVRRASEVLGGKCILAKLTPNVEDIVPLALSAEGAGADGIVAVNTIVGMDIDVRNRKLVFDRVTAGLSGPAILPVALAAVWKIARSVEIPVVGVGGISSVDDALKFFMAGAAAVEVGTAIFYDPELPVRIIERLEKDGIPERLSG
ncbi:MAG: dihydroorotate dehydrogenase B catalytic subunit [Candidatus Latescibacteria bacterium 4484_7]|nr:MAG: dihydroorotate dehydrogenase B catalytic subunit [Candidatus Latescibacteria bacterium 4484_7]RKY20701.1 MAG: dihydroorotate dehydrogenase [Planctomycetota bacterium]